MKPLLPYCILIYCLFSILSLYSQSYFSNRSPLAWFDEKRFEMVDDNQDGALNLKELQNFYHEFSYFLNDNRFFFVDLNQDGRLNWGEIYPHLNDAWTYRKNQEKVEILKLQQKYPFFTSAKLKYLKRNSSLTQILISNYTWVSQHLPMVIKLCKDQSWLRKHPLIVLHLHTNLRCLVDHPQLASVFYQLSLFDHLPPSFLAWRLEHLSQLAKASSSSYSRSSNAQRELLRPVGPVHTPIHIQKSNLYSLDPPPNWKHTIDSIQIVNQSLRAKDYRQTQQLTRLQSDNKLLSDKVDYLTQSSRQLTSQIIRERDSLLQQSRKQTSDLRSIQSSLNRSENRRKELTVSVNTELDSIKSYYHQLLAEKKDQELRIENLLRENSALKSRTISPTVNENNRNQVLQRRLDQQTAEIERLRKDIAYQRELLAKTTAVLRDSIGALRQKTAFPTPPPAELSLMRESLQALQIKMASVEQQANNKISQLSDSLVISRKRLDIQRSQYEALISQLESRILELENEQTQSNYSTLSENTHNELKLLQQRLQVLTLENESMREQLEANSNFVASILAEKEEFEQSTYELRSENQRLQEVNEHLVSKRSSSYSITEDSITNYKKELANLEQLLGNKDNAYKIDKELAARRAKALEEIIAEQEMLIENLEKERKVSRERLVTIANKERQLEKERALVQKRAQLLKQRESILQARERSLEDKAQKYEDLRELENSLKLREQQLKGKEQIPD